MDKRTLFACLSAVFAASCSNPSADAGGDAQNQDAIRHHGDSGTGTGADSGTRDAGTGTDAAPSSPDSGIAPPPPVADGGASDASTGVDSGSSSSDAGAPPPSQATFLPGVNLAGAEFGSNVPGTYGTDYIYPTSSEVDYFVGKGMKIFRLPFRWERLQTSLNAPFDSAELARMDDFVTYATSKCRFRRS